MAPTFGLRYTDYGILQTSLRLSDNAVCSNDPGNRKLNDKPKSPPRGYPDLHDHLRALEDAIENFAGCAVVISHDRFFLDRLATHILAFEGNSHVEWFEGNFEAYEEDKRRRLGDAADRPTRLAYKKLTR